MDHWAQIERMIPEMQALATSGMTDTVHLERPTGRAIRVDGKTVPEMETVWSGVGKVQSQQGYPSQPEVGGGTATMAVFEVHIPASETVSVLVDDVFAVDESRDAVLPGSRFRVRVDPAKTWRTARRFNCEEVIL